MAVHVEITDPGGSRELTVDADRFWIGTTPACAVQLQWSGLHARLVEVRVADHGALEVRAEPGLDFPVRCATGNVGARFQSVLDGDVLNAGPAMLRLRAVGGTDEASLARAEEIDLGAVQSPGAPVGPWYERFMAVADHLEGLRDPAEMVRSALSAVLSVTGADRVHLVIDVVGAPQLGDRGEFFLAHDGSERPFRVSSSIVDRVRESGRVVHVPVAAADPVASRFVSVQREGISSGIALPLSALGRRLGVLYADCVRDGAVLSAEDLQRVAFVSRLLASALGNRSLVASLARREGEAAAAEHPALRTRAARCQDMVERVRLYAPTDYTVLLRGETGAGKEVLARAIHDLSRRCDGPFVPVNCAAIPEQLMESMLFGHEKGAFTGAMQSREGHFQEAHGGTLFLDEIGDMALDLQAKILRVLQDREVTPVGATRRTKVDVRIVAATHQDLEHMVRERRFREDLYYRLRELEIALPPLRARPEDLPMLTAVFLEEAQRELRLDDVPEIADEALAEMASRSWRGNIRELRHTVKGAALRARGGVIRAEHLDAAAPSLPVEPARDAVPTPPSAAASTDGSLAVPDGELPLADGATWKERLEQQERVALADTLERAGGNLTKAARLFGVPRTTYREKLVKAGLLEA